MSNVITSPFSVFYDRSGQPLDNGYIYIGTAGINPEVSPIAVYWDASLTNTAAQPIRTLNGYPSRNGSPSSIIASQPSYSILVRDKNGALVYSNLNFSENDEDQIRSVPTYAALTALNAATGLEDGGVYYTQAETTTGDGGARHWLFNSASTATPDGETVLAIDGGGAGRFFLLNKKVATVLSSALTATTNFVQCARNTLTTGYSIYDAIFPGITHFDSLQGVTVVPTGSTIEHATGISGYIDVQGPPTNGVALYGAGIASVNNAAVWGINTLLQDQATRTAGTNTGRRLTNEFDFNVMNPGTEVVGCSIGGNSLAQPTVANGFLCNTLSATFGYKWETAFYSLNGAATNGLAIGALSASGSNIASQKILVSYIDGGGVVRTAQLQASGGFMILSGTHLSLDIGASLFLQAGQTVTINGNGIIGDRVTGFTTSSGTANKNASGINVDTITATDANIRALGAWVKALNDAMTTHGLIGT